MKKKTLLSHFFVHFFTAPNWLSSETTGGLTTPPDPLLHLAHLWKSIRTASTFIF